MATNEAKHTESLMKNTLSIINAGDLIEFIVWLNRWDDQGDIMIIMPIWSGFRLNNGQRVYTFLPRSTWSVRSHFANVEYIHEDSWSYGNLHLKGKFPHRIEYFQGKCIRSKSIARWRYCPFKIVSFYPNQWLRWKFRLHQIVEIYFVWLILRTILE